MSWSWSVTIGHGQSHNARDVESLFLQVLRCLLSVGLLVGEAAAWLSLLGQLGGEVKIMRMIMLKLMMMMMMMRKRRRTVISFKGALPISSSSSR